MGDLGTLLELTTTDTGDEMLKWYVAVRPLCEQFKATMQTPTPFVEVVVNKEDSNNGTASVVARLNTDEPLTRTGALNSWCHDQLDA